MACKETKIVENPNLGKTNAERIREALDAGAVMIKEAKVKSVSISGYDEEEYTTEDAKNVGIILTFEENVARNYVAQADLTFKLEDVNYVNLKLFDIAGYISNTDDDDTSFIGKHIVRNPRSLERLLAKAYVNILQQEIKAGTQVVSMFSIKKEVVAKTYDNDFMKSTLCQIVFSDKAKKKIERIEDKILGI